MGGNRVRRPVVFWLTVVCAVGLVPVIVFSVLVTRSSRDHDPFADEPDVLFDLNASDYGEGMRVVSLSDEDGQVILRDPYSSVVYVGMSNDSSSVILALDAATMNVRWEAPLNGPRPYCVQYAWGVRCSAGGELVNIAASDGTVTALAALPAPTYRMRKNEEANIVYLLPADEQAQEYQMMQIGDGARAVVLPWSPPLSPCSAAFGTSFKDVDPGVGDNDMLAAVVVDGWMVLSNVDTGEIVDRRFGELYRQTTSTLLSGDEACGSEWSKVSVSYPNGDAAFSVVSLPGETAPKPPPADEARPVIRKNDDAQWYVTRDGEAGEGCQGGTANCGDAIDLHRYHLENAFANGLGIDEGVVKRQTGLGLSTTREEYMVLVSAGRLVSIRKNGSADESGKMMWDADIGDDEWQAKCGVVMLRGSDGRVTARSIDHGNELWGLETPADMRWDNHEKKGVEGGCWKDSISLVLYSDSRILIYGGEG
mgnify:FL=1